MLPLLTFSHGTLLVAVESRPQWRNPCDKSSQYNRRKKLEALSRFYREIRQCSGISRRYAG